MKVFLINLASNLERMAVADAQLRRLSVDYERFDAVYGKALSEAEKKQYVNYFRWWCAVGRPICDGEIGCALSHYRIYERMIKESVPYFCVLEDDVVLTKDFPKQLAEVEKWLDGKQPQVVLLSNHTKERQEGWGIYPTKRDMFTEGYVITLPAAKALLQANLPMQTPCDHWGRWVKSGAIQLYHAFPTVCSQPHDTTDIAIGIRYVKDFPLPLWVWHKFKRLVGKTIDWMLGGT